MVPAEVQAVPDTPFSTLNPLLFLDNDLDIYDMTLDEYDPYGSK